MVKSMKYAAIGWVIVLAVIVVAGGLSWLSLSCFGVSIKEAVTVGKDFKVELYSGPEIVRTWTSSGKVLTEQNSDGWRFVDKETKKFVRVTGTLVITEI